MTRKDYEAFAAMFRNQLKEIENSRDEQVFDHLIGMAHDITCLTIQGAADIFLADNENFSRRKFYEACGVWNYMTRE